MTTAVARAETRDWPYDGTEILADGVVHVLGLVLALAGTFVLFGFVEDDQDRLSPNIIYCATLLVSLGISAAYNLWPVSKTKWVLRRFDHAMIFGLIAGTYTPFLAQAGTAFTTWLLGLIWGTSLLGMGLKLLDIGRREWLSTLLYIGLGWSGLLALNSLVQSVPAPSLVLVVVGGILYSGGTIFHHWRSLRFQNAIWHGFVLVAASCHFVAVLLALNLDS